MRWKTWMLVLGLVAACGGDDKDADGESDEGGDVGLKTGAICDTALTYQDVQPIFQQYCVTCHDSAKTGAARNKAPTDHNFDTQDGVLDATKHIDEQAGSGPLATNTAMPIEGYPAPSKEQRETLSKWIACQPVK